MLVVLAISIAAAVMQYREDRWHNVFEVNTVEVVLS
jgi:hypothetical protein